MPGPADAHDAWVYCAGVARLVPADAHDASVFCAGVKCLAQLMLIMLGFITPVWNAWPS